MNSLHAMVVLCVCDDNIDIVVECD